jgi:Dyp-type peroxidase family
MRLDLTDIQGNLLRGYRLPFARYLHMNFGEAGPARAFLDRLMPLITSAETWDEGKPAQTINISLSRTALEALELPRATINSFPIEFLAGMASRRRILGDDGPSDPAQWDPVWRGRVDLSIAINALSPAALEAGFTAVMGIAEQTRGATLAGRQDAAALIVDGAPAPIEHFGFTDGFSQPDFIGGQASDVPGDGKIGERGRWDEIETGEFLLGYRSEADETPPAPVPPVFAKNGAFLVYRKLEQDVKAFRAYFAEWGARYPGGPEKLMAKFVGRWRDGTPLASSPDRMDPSLANDTARNNNFIYADDPEGLKCPIGAHIRRMNPRDSLGFEGRLATRRRILRRGLPYGPYAPEGVEIDSQPRGIIFLAVAASLSRQFEFVQQQWVNYGNDFGLGEDRDPIIGNNQGSGRFVIPGDIRKHEEPFVCSGLPSFVTVKGGDYFFIPSLTALRLLATGRIDPR